MLKRPHCKMVQVPNFNPHVERVHVMRAKIAAIVVTPAVVATPPALVRNKDYKRRRKGL